MQLRMICAIGHRYNSSASDRLDRLLAGLTRVSAIGEGRRGRDVGAAGDVKSGAARKFPQMKYKDYYAILGVKREATADDIERRTHHLARNIIPGICFEGKGRRGKVQGDGQGIRR